ncbi:MAG: hypothetical protein B7Z52_03055 [Burkholderiales bacterium 12-64-5]|nr:MAG: hypothetical protein B7Z52_03055 [Burkholderiales bacterium 12-64-5]
MKPQWARFQTWLEALSLRERAMVFAAGVAVIGFLLWLGLLQPLVDGNRRLTARLAGHNSLLATLTPQTDELRRLQAVDPDAVVRDQLADIDKQLAEIVMVGDLGRTFLHAERIAKIDPELVGGLFGVLEQLGVDDRAEADINLEEVFHRDDGQSGVGLGVVGHGVSLKLFPNVY